MKHSLIIITPIITIITIMFKITWDQIQITIKQILQLIILTLMIIVSKKYFF